VSDLFAQVYLDEDVSIVVALMLRSRHFNSVTTIEAGNGGCSDEEQLAHATSTGFVLLTHNRVHFEQLAAAYAKTSKQHAGIIIAVRRTESEILKRLLPLLNQFAADEFVNEVRYI
jgi:hypothetical protein